MTANQVSVRFVKQQGRLGQVHIGPALREALYEAGWSDDTRVATLIDRAKSCLPLNPWIVGHQSFDMALERSAPRKSRQIRVGDER